MTMYLNRDTEVCATLWGQSPCSGPVRLEQPGERPVERRPGSGGGLAAIRGSPTPLQQNGLDVGMDGSKPAGVPLLPWRPSSAPGSSRH